LKVWVVHIVTWPVLTVPASELQEAGLLVIPRTAAFVKISIPAVLSVKKDEGSKSASRVSAWNSTVPISPGLTPSPEAPEVLDAGQVLMGPTPAIYLSELVKRPAE